MDAGDLVGWLSLIAPEVTYSMPVQASRLREGPGTGTIGSFYFKENRASLELRIKRLVGSPSV